MKKKIGKKFTAHVLKEKERKAIGVNVKQECSNGTPHNTIIIAAIGEKTVHHMIKACKRLNNVPVMFTAMVSSANGRCFP